MVVFDIIDRVCQSIYGIIDIREHPRDARRYQRNTLYRVNKAVVQNVGEIATRTTASVPRVDSQEPCWQFVD